MSVWEFEDMSSLNQESNVNATPNFNVGNRVLDDLLYAGSQLVSLEDQQGSSSDMVLYDNIVAEDIFSNECINNMYVLGFIWQRFFLILLFGWVILL